MAKSDKDRRMILWCAGAAIMVLGVVHFADPPDSSRATSQSSVEDQEFAWISMNQGLVAARMKDPPSARFGDDYVSHKSGSPIVCGTVNAKNSYGGYAGSQRYIGAGETVGVYVEGEVDDFPELWADLC